MSGTLLDFEKPLEDLNEQLEKAKQISEKGKVNVDEVIREIESKIEKAKQDIFSSLTPWQRVQLSRHPDRPYTLDYINAITGGQFMELFGDRQVKDDKAMIGGFGDVDGQTVMFVGQQKVRIRKCVSFAISECRTLKDIAKHYVCLDLLKNLISPLLP